MNVLFPRSCLSLTSRQSIFSLSHVRVCPKTSVVAIRHFSTEGTTKQTCTKSLYPLHEAVENGDVERVKRVLKTDIVEVNGLNSTGELPLVIAAKKYQSQKDYPGEILQLLHEYGACYLFENGKGECALEFPRSSLDESKKDFLIGFSIAAESMRQVISGCGYSISKCTNKCKDESAKYTAEFKARVALESLSTELSIESLAMGHNALDWEVIKWRRQAREGLVNLFNKTHKNALVYPLTSLSDRTSNLDCTKSLYPLHEAVENGDVGRVKRVLKNDIVEVNELNSAGELPLVIAGKMYQKQTDYPGEILQILQEYGASYLLKNSQGESASTFIKMDEPNRKDWAAHEIRRAVLVQQILSMFPPAFRKNSSMKYSSEFKAKVALESLSTPISIGDGDLASKARTWEVIEWRWKAREGLVNLFKEKT